MEGRAGWWSLATPPASAHCPMASVGFIIQFCMVGGWVVEETMPVSLPLYTCVHNDSFGRLDVIINLEEDIIVQDGHTCKLKKALHVYKMVSVFRSNRPPSGYI